MWTWLYTRGRDSVRIVIEGMTVTVSGPGEDEEAQTCDTEEDALFQQKLIEQRLILKGWTLDRLITERRSGRERRDDDRGPDRRRR